MKRRSQLNTNLFHRAAALVSEHPNMPAVSIHLLEEGPRVGSASDETAEPGGPWKAGWWGATVENLAPACEGDAPDNPGFRFFTVAWEDPFRSFLSVPMVRGKVRIGGAGILTRQA